MRGRCPAAIACSVLSAVAFVACGGSNGSDNGVAAKSPDAILSAAADAVAKAGSVHVSGADANGAARTTLDLSLVSGKGGAGSVAQNGLGFKLVALNRQVYINGSQSFWQRFGGAAAVQLLSGKWLKAPATGRLAALAMLTHARVLFRQLMPSDGALTKGKTTTVRGRKVIAVTNTAKGRTLYVATEGKPYPIEIVTRGSPADRVDFDRFNAPVSLSAPPHAIAVRPK